MSLDDTRALVATLTEAVDALTRGVVAVAANKDTEAAASLALNAAELLAQGEYSLQTAKGKDQVAGRVW